MFSVGCCCPCCGPCLSVLSEFSMFIAKLPYKLLRWMCGLEVEERPTDEEALVSEETKPDYGAAEKSKK